MTKLGFHFHLNVTPKWSALVSILDRRAVELGYPAQGKKLRPRAHRAVYGGTFDRRLQRGALRYDAILRSLDGIIDVQPTRTDGHMSVHFHADLSETTEDYYSDQTVAFASHGLFLPEQHNEHGMVAHEQLVGLRLWDVMAHIADLELSSMRPDIVGTGTYAVKYAPLAVASEWAFGSKHIRGDYPTEWTLDHDLLGLTMMITPMAQ